MKKIILISTLLSSLSMADSVLLVKKGWQLIGSSTPLTTMSKFKSKNVEQVWHFDAKSQTWSAYSPDATIQKRMTAKSVSKLQALKNWHGFWVKSKKDWSLTFKNNPLTSEPTNKNNSDIIELRKGWNLISLPVNSVLSSDIFKGMTVWKYNKKAWEFSGKVQNEENFPRLGHIKNSDGIWVKAENDQNISVMTEASKLHNFTTFKEMESYIKEMATISRRLTCGIEPFYIENQHIVEDSLFQDSIAPTSSNVKDASSTNLQENGVDEADILKHNGKNIFYIGTSKNGKRDHINISSFEKLVGKEKIELNRVSLKNRYISSFYLVKNRLVVLSRKEIEYPNRIENDIKVEYKEQGIVDIFDVSNINKVKKVAEYKVDGSFKNSRVIGDNLYLISSFYPKYEITYPKEYLTPPTICNAYLDRTVAFDDKVDFMKYADCFNIIKEDNRYFRYNYDAPNVKITDLLPEINEKELVTPKRLYASAKQKQSSTITTISNFSIADAKYLKSISFIGDSSIEYASSKSLYFVSNGYPLFYDFNNYKQRSTIYKFNFDEVLSYKAIGSVDGTALNQFALSEYNDVLRIATTEGFSWGKNGTKNRLYTLKEKDGFLLIEGILNGLGKTGESIKSVRFMGTKGYLVTFKTTDPLYTLDLSNPKSPKKMGELKVNGYSAYLHPIGENRLLGIGQDTDEEGSRKGVKIELFDISDFENPSSLDSILLPKGTSSELEYNHKALAFRESDNLFAFPYQHYINGFVSSFTQNNLGIYQVTESGLKEYETIVSNNEKWGELRGLIFDFNNKTYISFFSDDTVISRELKEKDK